MKGKGTIKQPHFKVIVSCGFFFFWSNICGVVGNDYYCIFSFLLIETLETI